MRTLRKWKKRNEIRTNSKKTNTHRRAGQPDLNMSTNRLKSLCGTGSKTMQEDKSLAEQFPSLGPEVKLIETDLCLEFLYLGSL